MFFWAAIWHAFAADHAESVGRAIRELRVLETAHWQRNGKVRGIDLPEINMDVPSLVTVEGEPDSCACFDDCSSRVRGISEIRRRSVYHRSNHEQTRPCGDYLQNVRQESSALLNKSQAPR